MDTAKPAEVGPEIDYREASPACYRRNLRKIFASAEPAHRKVPRFPCQLAPLGILPRRLFQLLTRAACPGMPFGVAPDNLSLDRVNTVLRKIGRQTNARVVQDKNP